MLRRAAEGKSLCKAPIACPPSSCAAGCESVGKRHVCARRAQERLCDVPHVWGLPAQPPKRGSGEMVTGGHGEFAFDTARIFEVHRASKGGEIRGLGSVIPENRGAGTLGPPHGLAQRDDLPRPLRGPVKAQQ